jgi:hypothetical protein
MSFWGLRVLILCGVAAFAQQQAPSPASSAPTAEEGTAEEDATEAAPEPEAESSATQNRTSLNLLGQTNAQSGESNRNQNVSINLVNNSAAQELNNRVGTTATIISEFGADRGYFSSEFGNAPRAPIHAQAQNGTAWHGNLSWAHNNSIFNSRSFFQVGGVQPARQNQVAATAGGQLWKGSYLSVSGSQDKSRGQVNGNILIPLPSERTPLTTDPATRQAVQYLLDGFPNVTPNRPDIAERAHNMNAPQSIDTNVASGQLTQKLTSADRLILRYQFTGQKVDAFQFVRGQNPNTRNKSHTVRITWDHTLGARTVMNTTAGFDRQGSLLTAAPGGENGPILITGLTRLGPAPAVPLDRAQNRFRYGVSVQHVRGSHTIAVGGNLTRTQINGSEPDGGLGITQFRPDFGRDAITNLRLGAPTSYVRALGTTYRGFRNWEGQLYASDRFTVGRALTLSVGLSWEPFGKPNDVTGRTTLKFDSDLNNLAPRFGFAYRLPHNYGTLRGAYGVMFGQIFPATYGQDRLNLPYNVRLSLPAPDLVNPFKNLKPQDLSPTARSAVYDISKDLATPYSHSYNFSWEVDPRREWHLQLGYVGSRTHKLFTSWVLNRAVFVPGIAFGSATINDRRPDQNIFDKLMIHNGGRAYYDAARLTLTRTNWHGMTVTASYWFSKAIDLGNDYTSTASGGEARSQGGQSGVDVHKDLKGRSDFDQPHALLLQTTYDTGRGGSGLLRSITKNWTVASVYLLKSGTPFTVDSGSDGLGVGNLDGAFGDRPNIVDPSILGRIIGNPDTSTKLLPQSAFAFMNAPTQMAGNLGRNTFRKGKIANVNASLSRTWRIHGDWNAMLRAESINLFNTPQFADPGVSVSASNFAQITNTLNDGRAFKFTFRLSF